MNCISSIAKWQLRLSRCSPGYYPLCKQMIISFIRGLTHKKLRMCVLCDLRWISYPQDRTHRASHFHPCKSRRTQLRSARLCWCKSGISDRGVKPMLCPWFREHSEQRVMPKFQINHGDTYRTSINMGKNVPLVVPCNRMSCWMLKISGTLYAERRQIRA